MHLLVIVVRGTPAASMSTVMRFLRSPLFGRPWRLPREGRIPDLFLACVVLAFVFSTSAILFSGPSAPTSGDDELDEMLRQEIARAYDWAARTGAGSQEATGSITVGADLLVTSDQHHAIVWMGPDSIGAVPVLLTDIRPGAHALRLTGGRVTLLDTVVVLSDGSFSRVHVPRRRSRAIVNRAPAVSPEPIALRGPASAAWSMPTPQPPAPVSHVDREHSRVAW